MGTSDPLIALLQSAARHGATAEALIQHIENAFPQPQSGVAAVRYFHQAFEVDFRSLSILPGLLGADGRWDYRKIDETIMPLVREKMMTVQSNE